MDDDNSFSFQLNFPKDKTVRRNGMEIYKVIQFWVSVFMNGVTAVMLKHVNAASWKCIEVFSPCFTLPLVWKAREFSCNYYFDCFITITYISVTIFIIINSKFCEVGLAKINVSFFFFAILYLLMLAKTSLMQFEGGHFWND